MASHFRDDFYACLHAYGDELFELTDALLCADGPVRTPVDLTLLAEHRRGHGALYAALYEGRIDVCRLRRTLAALPQPQAANHRLVLAVDVTNWLRPDAECSPGRMFCHTFGRGRDQHLMIPGWPYSFVAALESGRTSWCQLLDAVRLGPEDDVAEVTAVQVRRVVEDLIAGGRWHEGDPDILVVCDAGYDAPRMAHLLDGLPVEILGRMRSDRVMRRPTPTQLEYANAYPRGGRPPKHGKEFRQARDLGRARCGDRPGHRPLRHRTSNGLGSSPPEAHHPLRLDRPRPRTAHHRGTLIRLQVDRLPGGGDPLPLWLWSSATGMTGTDVDLRWQAFLRRFDLEHTFRMIKQTLGWTRPKLRTPEAAVRWTWLIVVAHTQLRLARPLAEDVRRPWERPVEPNRLTPARVRRGFRNLRPHLPCPARAPKPTRPGPGRPLGSKNQRPATRYDVGKTVKRPESIIERNRARP